jgi:rare lipoprotein A (peptidoglycan hydrolase)
MAVLQACGGSQFETAANPMLRERSDRSDQRPLAKQRIIAPLVGPRPFSWSSEAQMKAILPASALFLVMQVGTTSPVAAAANVKPDKLALQSSSHRVGHKTHRAARSGRSGQTGVASYYSRPQRVSSGGRFNADAMTAAHRTLPFGTRVRVTHASNGRSVDVRINDRGPFTGGRIIDLSRAAAQAIGMAGQGVARVRVTVLGR